MGKCHTGGCYELCIIYCGNGYHSRIISCFSICIEENDKTVAKLAKVADEMEAELINYAPLYQIQAPEKEIYLDFLCNVIGIKSFDYLIKRSHEISFDGIYKLNIASLENKRTGFLRKRLPNGGSFI